MTIPVQTGTTLALIRICVIHKASGIENCKINNKWRRWYEIQCENTNLRLNASLSDESLQDSHVSVLWISEVQNFYNFTVVSFKTVFYLNNADQVNKNVRFKI